MDTTTHSGPTAYIFKRNLKVTLTQLQSDVAECEKYVEEQRKLQEKEALQHRLAEEIQQLATLGDRINALATQLEAEMLSFKEIAQEANQTYHAIQQPPDWKAIARGKSKLSRWKPCDMLEVDSPVVPTVVRRGSRFILRAKTVESLVDREDDVVTGEAKSALQRREALERWLVEKRKRKQVHYFG